MSSRKFSYGCRSLAAFGMMVIITQAFHPIVLLEIHLGMTAAWILCLLGGLLATLTLWPVAHALSRTPGSGLMDLARGALGEAGAALFALLLAALLSFSGGLILRETAEMAVTAVFPHTPQTFATFSLLIGALFVAYGDSSGVVRLGRAMLPTLVIAILAVLAGSVGWGRVQFLLPLWGPGLPALVAASPATAAFYTPVVTVALMAGGVRERRHLTRWMLLTPLAGMGLMILVKAVLVMVFPYPMGADITYPLHAAARIGIGGRFLERLEGIWLFTWVGSTIAMSGALLHASALAMAGGFGIRRHTDCVLPLATVVLTVAFFSHSQAETVNLHEGASLLLFAVLLLLPAAVSAVAMLRQRRGRLGA